MVKMRPETASDRYAIATQIRATLMEIRATLMEIRATLMEIRANLMDTIVWTVKIAPV